MITKIIQGDLLSTTITNIAHGVNCQDRMGSGVAKALFTVHPQIKSAYHEFCHATPLDKRLGEVQPVECDSVIIYNCFTQFNYGYNGDKYVSYEAILRCFKTLNKYLKGEQLAIPKVGCGLAGGNWQVVKALIDEATPDLEIHVYDISKHIYQID